MTKSALPMSTKPSLLAATPSAFAAHSSLRLRGPQTGTVAAYQARSPHARVTLTLGTVLMTFWSTAAAQGVLEGISAAKPTLIHLPADLPTVPDPYGQPSVSVDWTCRPSYAAVPQQRVVE